MKRIYPFIERFEWRVDRIKPSLLVACLGMYISIQRDDTKCRRDLFNLLYSALVFNRILLLMIWTFELKVQFELNFESPRGDGKLQPLSSKVVVLHFMFQWNLGLREIIG